MENEGRIATQVYRLVTAITGMDGTFRYSGKSLNELREHYIGLIDPEKVEEVKGDEVALEVVSDAFLDRGSMRRVLTPAVREKKEARKSLFRGDVK